MPKLHPFITLVREGRYNLPRWNSRLPFSEKVEYVSYNFEWSPKDSIYKLILMFCLPEMQKRWETLRSPLLRSRLSPAGEERIQQLILHYAQEGKIIQLAALLLIDPPRFRSKYGETDRLTTIEMARELVATKMVSLIVEDKKLIVEDKKLTGRSKKLIQKKRLMSVMMLLEICERIGAEIEYLVSGSHVIYISKRAEAMAELLVFMFKDSGFPVTNELEVFKHMNCKSFLDEPQVNVSGKLCGSTYDKHPYYSLYNKFESPAVVENRRARMQLGQQRRSISTHSMREKPGLCSLVQSFCTSQRFKTRFSPKFCTNTEAQTRKTVQVIRKQVPGLVLGKKISTFLSAIKRGI